MKKIVRFVALCVSMFFIALSSSCSSAKELTYAEVVEAYNKVLSDGSVSFKSEAVITNDVDGDFYFMWPGSPENSEVWEYSATSRLEIIKGPTGYDTKYDGYTSVGDAWKNYTAVIVPLTCLDFSPKKFGEDNLIYSYTYKKVGKNYEITVNNEIEGLKNRYDVYTYNEVFQLVSLKKYVTPEKSNEVLITNICVSWK